MKRLPIYGDKTLRLSMEFGIVLSEVAKERGIELTPEISQRAEDIFIKEIREQGLKSVACQFTALVLVCFET
jgi:hypothetical protein